MLLGVSRGLLNRPHHQGELQVAFRGSSMLAGLEADDTCIVCSVGSPGYTACHCQLTQMPNKPLFRD